MVRCNHNEINTSLIHGKCIILNRHDLLTCWSNQLIKNLINKRLLRAMCSKLIECKLHHNIRCLKAHGKTKEFVTYEQTGSKLICVSLAKMKGLCLIGLGTQKWGTCLRNLSYVKVNERVEQRCVHSYQATENKKTAN
jgi:hypothetical protein